MSNNGGGEQRGSLRASTQQEATQSVHNVELPAGFIALDPALRHGQLDNGLTYYVQHNPKPERRVVLRLAVRVGSLQEEEHERGLAHFVEHMGFKGTKSFEQGDLVKFLESIGASFGADLNAHTSMEE